MKCTSETISDTPLALALEGEAGIPGEVDEGQDTDGSEEEEMMVEEEERRDQPPPATPDPETPDTAEPEFAMESKPHAFRECPKVAEAWIRVRAWAKELYPEMVLPENYTQSVTSLFKCAKIEGDKLTKNICKGLVREDLDISGNDNNGEAEEEEEEEEEEE
ncbi:hypothetical protein BGX26_006658, partial [Mortierella sp. AD094]